MTYLTKKQRQELFIAEFLRRRHEAPPGTRVYMCCGMGDQSNEDRKIEIKAPRDTLSPLGWFYKHNAMHNGAIPIERDQWGRCARCVTLGFFRCSA